MSLRCYFSQLLRSRLSAHSNTYKNSVRHATYKASPFAEDIEPTVKYEVSKNPEEWKYVERALPLTIVPQPIRKESYPSGWKPQTEDVKKLPYLVQRTKNHMIPVYLQISQRGVRRHTFVRKIQGDINLLEQELKEFLQKESFQPIRSQVNELTGIIRINGDHVNAIKYFLEKKNL
ncbi:unnamed protein product [Phyllotreta striolata]|uniref:Large ribosomal subunit protein mL49 n=1 Tax=Phyllotreta striolata TaxID=444603 RepID=A0A9N9XIZ9_PHYSR|nr:unnamed protein product [Phyllotreta striolata]